MYVQSPTISGPSSSISPQTFTPLRTKLPSGSFYSRLCNRVNPNYCTVQLSSNLGVSKCDLIMPVNDWLRPLQVSIASGDLFLGQSIHGLFVKFGYLNDAFACNNLINMYSKFNRMGSAQMIFDEMLERNTITWTTLINGYSLLNDVESVFQIARNMHKEQEEFNEHTCSVILRACESQDYLIQGEQVHSFVVKNGLFGDVVVGTSLVSMYSRSGCLEDVERLYSDLTNRDVRCMNLLISVYGKVGYEEKAIRVFLDLLASGLYPSDYTFTSVISACSGNLGVGMGRQLHSLAVKHGLVDTTSVGNAIITMYGKHGLVEEAECMFCGMGMRNLVSWTAVLSAYVKNANAEKGIRGFLEMVDSGICIDSSCLCVVLDGCSKCKNLKLGLQLHGLAVKVGFLSDVIVGTALIDLYAKCRNLPAAKLVANALLDISTASFNATLSGYTNSGNSDLGPMILLNQLRLDGIKPDSITIAQLLSLSADQASLVCGASLHAYSMKTGFGTEFIVGNAVVSMYAKCGGIKDAFHAFVGMQKHDLVSWNAMISAYTLHGQGKNAISIFEEMVKEGCFPDDITILSVLQGCSYSGLWEYGFNLFSEMEQQFGIKPALEHYACMVDLLGRAGKFAEAIEFIDESPFSYSPLVWRTLVHACKVHRNFHFGRMASKHLLDLAPKEAGSYILVSNLYSEGGMFDEAARVRTLMNDSKVIKESGCSWIEIDNEAHRFVASCKDHRESGYIYALLDLLYDQMKQTNGNSADLPLT